jgi:glucosamine-6-phosphate deaminase
MLVGSEEMRSFKAGTAKVEIYPDAVSMGKAAKAVANAIREIETHHETINVIFATGASQVKLFDALTKMKELPWNKVRDFHMDEYIGLPIQRQHRFADICGKS